MHYLKVAASLRDAESDDTAVATKLGNFKRTTFRVAERRGYFARAALAVATLLAATAALAIQPGQWSHTTEADYEPGESDGVVVTNLGDIKLASSTSVVAEMPQGVNIVYDLRATANGDLYIAAGPEGRLLRRRGDQVAAIAELKSEQIFAIDQSADGGLLVAVSGETSRLALLDGDQLKTIVELPGVRYIWDMVVDGNDVYLATGPEGKLLDVNLTDVFAARAKPADKPATPATPEKPAPAPAPPRPDAPKPDPAKPAPAATPAAPATPATPVAGDKPKSDAPAKPVLPVGVRVVLDTTQANLLCLGRDQQGRLYAGTDTDGLVYRITPNANGDAEAFVLYDAPEPEIFTLLVMADGTVYAGTADAEQARPGRLEAAVGKEEGRPAGESDKPALPLPPKPEPKPAPKPAPNATPAPKPSSNAAPDAPEGVALTAGKPESKTGDATVEIAQATKTDKADAAGTPGTPAAPAAEPTPQQYDQLREEIRQRLQKARQTGELQAGPSTTPRTTRPIRPTTTPSAGRPGSAAAKPGNAVYRIDTQGFVTEVFRESALILRIMDDGNRLLVATGTEGQLFRIDLAAEEVTMIADLDSQQIPALIKGADGKVLVGTGSPAKLVRLEDGFAATGSYTSPVLDASQISLWGKLILTTTIPDGTAVSIQTRSGNVQDPQRASWSKWSLPRNLAPDDNVSPVTPREIAVTSPPARFIQYRVTLSGNGKATSVVDRVSLAYVVPNLKPNVAAVRASYPDATAAGGVKAGGARPAPRAGAGGAAGAAEEPPVAEQNVMTIEWEASDPNNDQLRYTLEYRAATGAAGANARWLPLAEDVTGTNFAWQTKRVPDGRYLIRVTASDAPDNPGGMARTASRLSDPVLIDNAPPAIAERQVRVEAGVVTLTATVSDGLSTLRAVQYAADTTAKWQPVLPDDLIFDSTKESITVKIAGLSTGSHVITLRATDALGNTQYVAETIEVK